LKKSLIITIVTHSYIDIARFAQVMQQDLQS